MAIQPISYFSNPQAEIRHVQLEDVEEFLESDDEVIRVYVVRHGESALNVLQDGVKYVQGQSPHVALTEKGQKQAEELTGLMLPKMKKLTPHIVTSPAKRAMDTAAPLLSALKKPAETYEEFLELGSGKWEGISKDDAAYVGEYQKWKNLPANLKFSTPKVPSGESYSQVAFRALDGFSKVVAGLKNKETVFVYGHQMLMHAVTFSLSNTVLSDQPNTSLPDLGIANGDMMMIEIPRGSSIDEGQVKMIIHSNLNG